jgi:diguanylate cyclase (GGDEF)-like protein
LKVLLVEDSISVGKTLAAELLVYNYEIIGPVATGEEALAVCRREPPDVVLMDIELSGKMDGIEAARRLQVQGGRQVPVIYLTGRVETATLEKAIESGSSTYLIKPVRAAELHANIQMTLRLSDTQKALQASEAKYKYLLDNIYDGYAYHRVQRDFSGEIIDFVIIEANDAFLKLFGTTLGNCLEKNLTNFFPEIASAEIGAIAALADVVKLKKTWQLAEIHAPALGRWFSLQAASPQSDRLAIVFADITERVKAEENIRFLGFHDPLTSLYNRAFFEAEFERLDQERLLPLSVIFADMNNLKYINDSFGHTVGDDCLIQVADILKDACRREDIVCRWGGDEFVILLPGTTNDVGNKICDRIRRRCKQMVCPGADVLCPGIAMGCATKGIVRQNSKDVFKEAEARMYLDKAATASLALTVEKLEEGN